jgi:hypothetical protein
MTHTFFKYFKLNLYDEISWNVKTVKYVPQTLNLELQFTFIVFTGF